MNRRHVAFLLLVALVVAGLVTKPALAASQTIDGITFNGPNTYQQCVDTQTSDTVTIIGLTGHNPQAHVQGNLKVWFILNAGANRQLINTIPVDSTKDLIIRVNYPPVSQWPPNGSPNDHEIHVDVAINVFVGGNLVGVFGPNPNLGWDVFCTTSIQTPTPTTTHTLTVTATSTQPIVARTVTQTPTHQVGQKQTVTATPTTQPPHDKSTDVPPTPGAPGTPTPASSPPVVAPTSGGTAGASLSALGMFLLFGLGLLGAGWALRRAVR